MSEDAQVQLVGFGANDSFEAQVDPSSFALRASLRPLEYQVVGGTQGGHYRAAFSYSNTAAKPAAGSPVFSIRWSDPVRLFALKRLQLWLACTTAYTAAGAQDAALWKVTGFSSADTGGTALSAVAGGQQRLYVGKMAATGLGSSAIGQISSGDTLSAGTRTPETYPLGYAAWVNPAAAGAVVGPFTLFDTLAADHPLICGVNEGFIVTTPIGNAQAAGVSKWSIWMDWAEIPSF